MFDCFRVKKSMDKYIWLKVLRGTIGQVADLVKDSLVLLQISTSQGGLDTLLSQSQPYMKGVIPIHKSSIDV